MGGEIQDSGQPGPPIRLYGEIGERRRRRGAQTSQVENSRGYLAAKELIYDAILRRSTDVHLEPGEGEVMARYRIDGVMYPTEPFDRSVGDAIINIFKVLSAMQTSRRSVKAAGRKFPSRAGRSRDRLSSRHARDARGREDELAYP